MSKKIGFTLAEALITLVIIGVVSALVIPSVLKNYNDKKYNTARLKALKTFGEAGKMASINGEINGQENARAFVENVLSKYLKIVKVCDTASECNFPDKIQPLDTSLDKYTSDDLKSWNNIGENTSFAGKTNISDKNLSTYVTTADGFSAKVFYNPKCTRSTIESANAARTWKCTNVEYISYNVDSICLNVIYDMSGARNPNHVGEDIGFVTVFWSGLNTTSAAPGLIPYNEAMSLYNDRGYTNYNASARCIQGGNKKNPYSLPNINELGSIFTNRYLSSLPYEFFWSGSIVQGSGNLMWYIRNEGYRSCLTNNAGGVRTWCVKR